METIKSRVFNNLTGSQKSELLHYLSKFVKKHFGKSCEDILDLYIEEEQYYLVQNASRHPWIEEYIDDETFIKDLTLCIKDNQKKYTLKEKQKPFIEKQKQIQKEQRVIARDRKMDRESPTKRQVYYYKVLCKKYGVEPDLLNLENASKLDYRKSIDALLCLEQASKKNEILGKLRQIVELKE